MKSRNIYKVFKTIEREIKSDTLFIGKPKQRTVAIIAKFLKNNLIGDNKYFIIDKDARQSATKKSEYIDSIMKVSLHSFIECGNSLVINLFASNRKGVVGVSLTMNIETYDYKNIRCTHSIKLINRKYHTFDLEKCSAGFIATIGHEIINPPLIKPITKSEEMFDRLVDVLNRYDLYQAPNEHNDFIGDEVHLALEDLKESIILGND